MLKNNFEPSFHLKNMVKDLELIVNTAQYTGVSLPLAAIAQQIYRAANNSSFSDYDYTAILALLMHKKQTIQNLFKPQIDKRIWSY
jgi:3-hydroxyisobutyrate dehydrogenase-like beta-hydroxyacid dehydrogenase